MHVQFLKHGTYSSIMQVRHIKEYCCQGPIRLWHTDKICINFISQSDPLILSMTSHGNAYWSVWQKNINYKAVKRKTDKNSYWGWYIYDVCP